MKNGHQKLHFAAGDDTPGRRGLYQPLVAPIHSSTAPLALVDHGDQRVDCAGGADDRAQAVAVVCGGPRSLEDVAINTDEDAYDDRQP